MAVRAETDITLTRVDDGAAGSNGATFTPSVDVDGDISWTNDGGLPNPPTQNIMGPAGSSGVSVTSVKTQYYLSTSDSSPTGGSWSDTPQTFVSGNYYWTRDYIDYSDGTHDTSTPVYNRGLTYACEYAESASEAADNASEYAARALGNLSTVQSVTETLNWITQHGTMALTTDVALDPTHVYFVVDAGGDYVVGGVTYAVVTEPDVDDIGTYYELTIDESLNNYVGTHLALTSEGLWLLPAASGTNKVLIAHGNGSVYTTAGTYLIDASGNAVASFRANGATMSASNGTQIAHLGYGPGDNGSGGTAYAPYYTFGIRNNSVHGNYSVAEGYLCEAEAYASHAEGAYCNAKSTYTHAEGNWTNATAGCAHAEGRYSLANAAAAHAEGYGGDSSSHTNATGQGSHAEGCVFSGYSIVSSGLGSHAEGDATTTNILASGNGSHAEGGGTTASGLRAHAEGSFTTASGYASHSSGRATIASGSCSHAQNLFTKASSDNQTALGMFNIEDSADTYAVIIGNGTADNARSDALTVDWSGNVVASGDVTDGSGNVLSGKQDTLVSGTNIKTVNSSSVLGSGDIDVTIVPLDTTAAPGTTDGDLYAAITALGWESDVIV